MCLLFSSLFLLSSPLFLPVSATAVPLFSASTVFLLGAARAPAAVTFCIAVLPSLCRAQCLHPVHSSECTPLAARMQVERWLSPTLFAAAHMCLLMPSAPAARHIPPAASRLLNCRPTLRRRQTLCTGSRAGCERCIVRRCTLGGRQRRRREQKQLSWRSLRIQLLALTLPHCPSRPPPSLCPSFKRPARPAQLAAPCGQPGLSVRPRQSPARTLPIGRHQDGLLAGCGSGRAGTRPPRGPGVQAGRPGGPCCPCRTSW